VRTPTESAAWLLTALHAARAGASGVDLRAFVASADAINHAVITCSEFKVGLELLLGCQCVADHGNVFALTEHGAEVLRQCGAYEVPTSGHLSRIAESLARLPIIAATSPVTEPVFAEVIASYAVALPHPLWVSRSA
jgi:hypothetical protein